MCVCVWMEGIEEGCKQLLHHCESVVNRGQQLQHLAQALGRFNRAFGALLHCASLQSHCVAVREDSRGSTHTPAKPRTRASQSRGPSTKKGTPHPPTKEAPPPPHAQEKTGSRSETEKRPPVWRRIGPLLPSKLQKPAMKMQVLGVWRSLRDHPGGMFLSELAGSLRLSRIQTNEILSALLRIGEVSRERKSAKGILYQLMAYADENQT